MWKKKEKIFAPDSADSNRTLCLAPDPVPLRRSPMPLFPWIVLKDWLASAPLPRVPEPTMAMENQSASNFADAGTAENPLTASYLFVAGHASESLQGRRRVMDLCCGPANQLSIIASLHPDIEFVGVDLSATMLTLAEKRVKDLGLKNIRFQLGDVCRLDGMPNLEFDGVMSTLALHHLPTLGHLRNCFQAVQQVLSPNSAIFLFDLGRLKTEQAVRFLARMNADTVTPGYVLDYEYSLRAAFLPSDFAALSTIFSSPVTIHCTQPLPVVFMMRTEARPLSTEVLTRLQPMIKSMEPQVKKQFNLIRFLFRLGGLKRNPFKK